MGFIGPAEIIWQPSQEGAKERTLWIRLHPAIFQEVWDVFKEAISKSSVSDDFGAGPSDTGYLDNSGIQIRDLRAEIDGFEIMGPTAAKILRRVLRLCKGESGVKTQVSRLPLVAMMAKMRSFSSPLDL